MALGVSVFMALCICMGMGLVVFARYGLSLGKVR